MILSKLFLNKIINAMVEHFRLDKVVNYVFDDNELDIKVKNHSDRIKILETLVNTKTVLCDKCNKKVEGI